MLDEWEVHLYTISLSLSLSTKEGKTWWVTFNHQFYNRPRERKHYCIQVYLSSLQHKNLDPYSLWLIDLNWLGFQWILKVNFRVKWTQNDTLEVAYYFMAFMLDKWEVCSYAIILSRPNQGGGCIWDESNLASKVTSISRF